MKLFLVGIVFDEKSPGEWEFIAICGTFPRALTMCYAERCFIAYVELNEKAPDETMFPEYFYPLRGDETTNPLPTWAREDSGDLL